VLLWLEFNDVFKHCFNLQGILKIIRNPQQSSSLSAFFPSPLGNLGTKLLHLEKFLCLEMTSGNLMKTGYSDWAGLRYLEHNFFFPKKSQQ
jgi:hypothetical protein